MAELSEAITIKTTPEMWLWLRMRAKKEGRTLSQMARFILQQVKDSERNHKGEK
jgi:hypothetical protein